MTARRTLAQRVTVLSLPAALGVIAAIAVWAASASGSLHLVVPLPTLLIACGLVISAALWGVHAGRAGLRRREMLAAEQGARREQEAHRRFIARLDHELKNPVTAIRAALESEADPTPGLTIAAGQAGRLATLIGELRSLSHLETAQIERVSVDLAAVISDEVTAFTEDLTSQGASRALHVQLPAAPWPLPQAIGDADLLAVAVRNLLVNAAKYSDEGARIEVRGQEDGGFIAVEVADTGWGIAQHEIPYVWDELWRGGQARSAEGSGLGLSLVRVVAERHGGDVAIRSLEGSGTAVRLRIPRA